MSLRETIQISNPEDKLLLGPFNDDMYDVNQCVGKSADDTTSPANASDDYSEDEGDYWADDETISGYVPKLSTPIRTISGQLHTMNARMW